MNELIPMWGPDQSSGADLRPSRPGNGAGEMLGSGNLRFSKRPDVVRDPISLPSWATSPWLLGTVGVLALPLAFLASDLPVTGGARAPKKALKQRTFAADAARESRPAALAPAFEQRGSQMQEWIVRSSEMMDPEQAADEELRDSLSELGIARSKARSSFTLNLVAEDSAPRGRSRALRRVANTRPSRAIGQLGTSSRRSLAAQFASSQDESRYGSNFAFEESALSSDAIDYSLLENVIVPIGGGAPDPSENSELDATLGWDGR